MSLISKFIGPTVADVLRAKLEPTLVGVLALPVSSNSTVKWKVPDAVMVPLGPEVARLAVADAVGPKVEQGVFVPPTVIPAKPPGKEGVPEFTHHSYVVGVLAPKPPAAA
jgi:hypothetical protein